MKLYTLMENTNKDECFACEHGLSLYIETKKHKILFDTGKTDLFAQNSEKMGVDLSEVDIAILSHGHYDHGGGLERFLEINDKAKVYINEHAFDEQFDGSERYIGLDKSLKGNDRFVFTGDKCAIDDELSLCTCNGFECVKQIDSAGLTVKMGDDFKDEKFIHEQYLTIKDNNRNVVISGCSHKGIINIMNWLKPQVLVGGFHFMNLDVSSDDRKTLDYSAEKLCLHETKYYTGHCTGVEQYNYLKIKMGDQLEYIKAGQINNI